MLLYNLWQESMALIASLSVTVTNMYVKAHQDDGLKKDYEGIRPLPRHSHYNIIVDKVAIDKRKELEPCHETILAPSLKASISIIGLIITFQTTKHIRRSIRWTDDYMLIRKEKMVTNCHRINWDAHERYSSQSPFSLKTIVKVIEYIHDWQNTVEQKGRSDSNRDEPGHESHKCMCPMRCGCVEK